MTIRTDTEELSLPEGRRVGQPGHEAALRYIEKRMAGIGLKFFKGSSFRLCYTIYGMEFTNLAGVLPGSDPRAFPVLLGAHYDSAVDGPSSDDNAVSVALILDACDKLTKLERRVIVAFFDAEEKPYFGTEKMGSVRFLEDHCGGIDFASVVVLDAIGHDFETLVPALDRAVHRIREMFFVLGSESHSLLPSVVEKASSPISGLRVIPTLNRYIGDSSDYMAFRKAGQPYLFLSRGNGKHTHSMKDNLEWVNFTAVYSVQRFLLELITLLDSIPMEQGRHGTDPFEYEIRMMRKAVGPMLPVLLPLLGIWKTSLQTRSDLDAVAAKLNRTVKLR